MLENPHRSVVSIMSDTVTSVDTGQAPCCFPLLVALVFYMPLYTPLFMSCPEPVLGDYARKSAGCIYTPGVSIGLHSPGGGQKSVLLVAIKPVYVGISLLMQY